MCVPDGVSKYNLNFNSQLNDKWNNTISITFIVFIWWVRERAVKDVNWMWSSTQMTLNQLPAVFLFSL